MFRLNALLLMAALASASPAWAASGPGDAPILRLADGRRVTVGEMLDDLVRARVVFVGELHGQAGHHRAQLEVVRAFHDRGVPVAVAMEMFRREEQPNLDRWVEGSLPIEGFLPVWYRNWNFPWVLYRDILEYAREHRLPVVGLNVPSEITAKVARDGFGSLAPDQLKRLPGVDCAVDGVYEDFIRRVLGDRAHGGADFRRFCEAQMVWDTTMAFHVAEYLGGVPDRRAVILAGSGHAWKRGMPARLRKMGDFDVRVVIPEIPGKAERDTASSDDADYLWLGITRPE